MAENFVATPFSSPIYVMAKPAGALCNLACKYCYYLEKKNLYTRQNCANVMSDDILEKFVKDYIEMQTAPSVLFTWHGGEPLMRPLSFYKRVLELQKKYANGKRIDNSIQTNGTLLTKEWVDFFKKNNFLVGVSIDGPKNFHDAYRKSKSGRPSWRQTMEGIRLLNDYGVDWNAMAVVNNLTSESPLDFYHFFKEINCQYLQFTPVVERIYKRPDGRWLASPIDGGIAQVADFSVSPDRWGNFLCAIFDEWVRFDVGSMFVQIFDSTLACWVGVQPSLCVFADTCGHAGVMEYNGDVYSCDHFVFPEFKLGNINQTHLSGMMRSTIQQQFGQSKKTKLTRQCLECQFQFACHGECPRNRFDKSLFGEAGHNYLCRGYFKYFEHVAPYMDFMKKKLLHNEAPADVMQWIKEGGK